jgi:DNA-binding response OmpR family regulator
MLWRVWIVGQTQWLERDLVKGLEGEGFAVTKVVGMQTFLDHVSERGLPHLAVVDVSPVDGAGLDVVSALSDRGLPVVAIGPATPSMVIEALERADDALSASVATAELAARILRILSSFTDHSYAGSPILEVDERLKVDYAANSLIVEGNQIPLTPIESRLLHTLMKYRGGAVDSRTLLLRVWSSSEAYEDTLRVHLHRLRYKLEVDPRRPRYIVTDRGVGYAFLPSPTEKGRGD